MVLPGKYIEQTRSSIGVGWCCLQHTQSKLESSPGVAGMVLPATQSKLEPVRVLDGAACNIHRAN